jgi:hypothetical protein
MRNAFTVVATLRGVVAQKDSRAVGAAAHITQYLVPPPFIFAAPGDLCVLVFVCPPPPSRAYVLARHRGHTQLSDIRC